MTLTKKSIPARITLREPQTSRLSKLFVSLTPQYGAPNRFIRLGALRANPQGASGEL